MISPNEKNISVDFLPESEELDRNLTVTESSYVLVSRFIFRSLAP
jgi:hypothetical protein